MSKLSRIKAKAAQVADKKAEIAADEAELQTNYTKKVGLIAQRKRALLALEIELAEEIAAITDLDGADPVPTKSSKA